MGVVGNVSQTPDPSLSGTSRNSHPFVKTTPGKNYPLVFARIKEFGGWYASEVAKGQLGAESQGRPGRPDNISA